MRAPKRASHRWPLVAITTLLGVVFLLPLILEPADVQKYYLALVLTALTLVPLIVRGTSGTLDLFEPIIPISMLIGLSYGVRAMYLAYAPATLEPILTGRLPFYDYIDRGLVVAIAAYCALLAGYYIVAAPLRIRPLAHTRFGRSGWPTSNVDIRKVAVLLGLAVLGSMLAPGQLGGEVSGTTTFVGILANLAQVTACVLALYIGSGDRRLWLRAVVWGIALPLAVWQSLVMAAKAYVLQLLYILLAARHYAKRPVRLPAFVAAAVLAALVIFPIVNVFRGAGYVRQQEAFGAPTAMGGRITQLVTVLASMGIRDYVQFAGEGLLSRSTGVDTLSLLLKYDVSEQLGNPSAYALIPIYAFVPRLVWPDKPVLDQGTRFGQLLLVPTFEGRELAASFGIYHFGDLFLSFGLAGLLFGMCAMGCVYRLTYRFFDPMHSNDLGIKFLYILVLWAMVNGFESDIPSTYSNLLKSLAVWAVIKVWLNQRQPFRLPAAPGVQPPPEFFATGMPSRVPR